MSISLSPDELSDLEDQFFCNHSDSIEKYEAAMIELFKSGRYLEFLAVVEQSEAFFSSFGPGGEEYYKNTWSNDPRVERAKNAVAMRQKYADSVPVGDARLEILDFVKRNSPAYAGDIYKSFPTFPRDVIAKAISGLCKSKQVIKDYDSGGRKFYRLP